MLDRTLFSKIFPISAARIANIKKISEYRAQLEKSKESLRLDRITNVQPDPEATLASKGSKCLLLNPNVKPEDPSTWSTILQEAVKKQEVKVVPYDLKLEYDYWTYRTYVGATRCCMGH